MLHLQILQDWTLVKDLEVDSSQCRTFEYHVVEDLDAERRTLTIKCLDPEARTVRLDPLFSRPIRIRRLSRILPSAVSASSTAKAKFSPTRSQWPIPDKSGLRVLEGFCAMPTWLSLCVEVGKG